jgi:membrane protease YdiL (CAAX protease family)
MSATRRIQVIIGLLLALGLPFCHLGALGKQYSRLGPLLGGEVLWWALFAAVLLYVLFVERKALSSLGFRRPGVSDIALGFLAALVMFMGSGVLFQIVLPALHLNLDRPMQAIGAMPMWFRLLTVTRAAVVEETVFRGYGFERLAELTRSPLIAGLVTFALFTLAHLSGGGWGQVIIAAFGGLVLTLLYMWRRNIWSTIVAHWMTDGAAFILLPLLMAHHH